MIVAFRRSALWKSVVAVLVALLAGFGAEAKGVVFEKTPATGVFRRKKI